MVLSENPTSSSMISSTAANKEESISHNQTATNSLETAGDQVSANDDIQSVSDNEWKSGTGPMHHAEDLNNAEIERTHADYVMLDREQNSPSNEFPFLPSSQQRNTMSSQINGFPETDLEK